MLHNKHCSIDFHVILENWILDEKGMVANFLGLLQPVLPVPAAPATPFTALVVREETATAAIFSNKKETKKSRIF